MGSSIDLKRVFPFLKSVDQTGFLDEVPQVGDLTKLGFLEVKKDFFGIKTFIFIIKYK